MPITLLEQIRDFLKGKDWIHGEEITKFGQSLGYEGETARRRLRDLLEDKVVETEKRAGKRTKSNWYRYIPQQVIRSQYVEREGKIIEVKTLTMA